MAIVRTLPVVCDGCGADLVVDDADLDTARCPNGCDVVLDITPPPAPSGVVHLNWGGGRGSWVDLGMLDMMDGTPL